MTPPAEHLPRAQVSIDVGALPDGERLRLVPPIRRTQDAGCEHPQQGRDRHDRPEAQIALGSLITMGTVAATGPKRSTENLAAGRDAMIGIC